MNRLPPDELRNLQITCFGLIVGPVMFLGIGFILRAMGRQLADVPALAYAAGALALASPVLAAFVRDRMAPAASSIEPPTPEKARAAVIVPFAILEAAVFLCAVAFLLTPTYWPLIAAAIPLGTMLAWFPRAG